MSDILPRIITIRSAAEPVKAYVRMAGKQILAEMIRVPDCLPDAAVARQFLSDLKQKKLPPHLILFGAKYDSRWRGQLRRQARND